MIFKNKEIKTIHWNEFFKIEEEKMIVFRIIPHSTLLNNQSYKLWRTLHGIYSKMSERVSRDGLKFRYRMKERIWFDITFRSIEKGINDKGEPILEKKIDFFLACPSYLAEHVKHHFEHHYKGKSAGITLENVEIDETQIPIENTNVCDLKLSKHDVFSIDADYSKQTTPISFLLDCVNDVRGNDVAKVSICAEPYNRMKWNSSTEVTHEKFKKGKTPKRMRLNGKNIFMALFSGLDTIYSWIEALMTDLIDIIDSLGSKEKRSNYYEKQRHKHRTDLEKKKILIDGKLSTSTERKKNAPVFKTHIRIASHSTNDTRREMTKRAIVTAFDQLSENNELKPIELSKKEQMASLEEINNFKLSMYSKSDLDANIFSNYEMGKLTQLPTADIQNRYLDEMKTNKKVETDIPSIFIHKKTNDSVKIDGIQISIGCNNINFNGGKLKVKKGKENSILVGHAEKQGDIIPIGIPTTNPDELYRSYAIMGEQGMGKDNTIQNFVVEGCLNHGISFVVIDQVDEEGLRGMANGIRDSLPSDKIIDLDLSNEDYLPPLDLSEIMKKLGRKGADRFANELIDLMNIEDMGQSKKLLRDFAKASNGSKYQLKELLENERFRVKRIMELREQGFNRLADEIDKYSSYTEYEDKFNSKGEKTGTKEKFIDGQSKLDGKAAALINRLDSFLGDDTLFNIFAQPPHEDFKLEQWIREGKVIIFRLPDRILSTVAVKVLVHWITLITLMTRLLMKKEGQKNGTFIVFNECHTYMTKGLEDLMVRIATQGRKEKLGALFAIQQFNLLPDRLKENLTGGGVNWLLFRSGNESIYEKFEKLGKLKPAFDVESAMSIEKWHSIAILNFGGRPQPAFLISMLKPSYKRYQPYDNSFLTKRHSQMFGRHYEEVEKLIESA